MTTQAVKLEPGLYRLTRDIANAHPDRRCKGDWRALPVIPAGKLFIVRPDAHLFVPALEQRFYIDCRNGHGCVASYIREDLFEALTTSGTLERLPEEPTDWLTRMHYETLAGEVLDRLARDGHLSLAQVQLALESILDESAEQYKNSKKTT